MLFSISLGLGFFLMLIASYASLKCFVIYREASQTPMLCNTLLIAGLFLLLIPTFYLSYLSYIFALILSTYSFNWVFFFVFIFFYSFILYYRRPLMRLIDKYSKANLVKVIIAENPLRKTYSVLTILYITLIGIIIPVIFFIITDIFINWLYAL